MIFSNKGGLAEQFVGQPLRAAQGPAMDPQQWTGPGSGLFSLHSTFCFISIPPVFKPKEK
jgi:hypothetical protein